MTRIISKGCGAPITLRKSGKLYHVSIGRRIRAKFTSLVRATNYLDGAVDAWNACEEHNALK